MADHSAEGASVPLLPVSLEDSTSAPSTPSGTMKEPLEVIDPLPVDQEDQFSNNPRIQEGPAGGSRVQRSEVGIAFSGGGIRSAAFCSGALRRILQWDPTLDNVSLSCVSGGGYTGAAFLEWKRFYLGRDDKIWQDEFFEQMHKNAGYMCNFARHPCTGLGHAILFLLMLLGVNVILACAVWFPYAVPTAYAVDFVFGAILRENMTCPTQASIPHGPANEKTPYAAWAVYAKCSPPVSRVLLFSFTLFFSLVSYLLSRLKFPIFFHNKGALRLLSTVIGLIFVMTLFPWFVYNFLQPAPAWLQWLIIFACLAMPHFFPITRNYAGLFLLFIVYAEIVSWRVYKSAVFGVLPYSDKVFFWVLFGSAVTVWLAPWVGALQQSVVNTHNRRQLTKAFFNVPAKVMCEDIFPWFSRPAKLLRKIVYKRHKGEYPELDVEQRSDGQLYMSDIRELSPTFISNITVNQWRVGAESSDPPYQLLAFSSHGIEVVGHGAPEDAFNNGLQPEHVRLSAAMATSAAALSAGMGSYDKTLDSVLDLFNLLGLDMGDDVVCDECREPGSKWAECCHKFVVPTAIELLCGVPLILLSIPYFLGRGESWVVIAVFVFFCILAVLSIIAVLPPTNRLVRWCIIHIFYVRFLRGFMSIVTNGPRPPPILRLSDGGHFENLALLPLLKIRLKKIIMVNGACISEDDNYGKALLEALQLARDHLHCSFIDQNGRDVIESVRVGLVMKGHLGPKPRSFRFKVVYYDDKDNWVSEGEVLFIAPRHPSKSRKLTADNAVNGSETVPGELEAGEVVTEQPELHSKVRWSHYGLKKLEGKKIWGTGPELVTSDVDNLTCCCCECCHSNNKCVQWVSEKLCGEFPAHSTANQFFTPAMFSAYHREGFCACLEANVTGFLGEDKTADSSSQ